MSARKRGQKTTRSDAFRGRPVSSACHAQRDRWGWRQRPGICSRPQSRSWCYRGGSDAHGHVDVMIDEVDAAVREEHPDIDLGERGDEIVHYGKHMQSRPKTTGAESVSSPRGMLYSPDACASASSTSSRMCLQEAT